MSVTMVKIFANFADAADEAGTLKQEGWIVLVSYDDDLVRVFDMTASTDMPTLEKIAQNVKFYTVIATRGKFELASM